MTSYGRAKACCMSDQENRHSSYKMVFFCCQLQAFMIPCWCCVFFFLNEDIRAVSVSHPYSLRWHNQPAWQAAVIVNKRYVRNCYMISDWTCWPRESWPWVTFNLWNMVYWQRIVNDRQISYAQAWAIISTHTYTHIAITHTNSRRTIHTNSRANTAIIFFHREHMHDEWTRQVGK